jgi:Fe(3+) dicitrate transport protein
MSVALAAALSCAAVAPAAAQVQRAPTAVASPTETARAEPDSLPSVVVIGTSENLQQQPGSGTILDARNLERSRTLTANEALRKAPGVNVRDEEGFGLRPNIGVRGQNPTRSSKVQLLEDGLPATYAPYGDNASYYHAPFDRYERIEVLKGVGMLRFGPQLTSGVINYITPDPPREPGGYAQLMLGNRGYGNAQLSAGGHGALFDFTHKRGDGARDNLDLEQTDLSGKYVADFGDAGALTLRANYLREDSQVTYSGITDAELANFGRDYNPFKNDQFDIERYGASLTHEIALGENVELNTSAYWFSFGRDWWRQSSTTTDTQCGAAFRDARLRGERVDVDACNSTQGRLRDYTTRGIEPRLIVWHEGLGARQEFELGVRLHAETQNRVQINAATPTGREGSVSERNRRTTDAVSAYITNRMNWGRFALTPIVRMEKVEHFRSNRLTQRSGTEDVRDTLAGLGATYEVSDTLRLFGGVHEGYAPPRAEDLIDNSGGSVEIQAERSINAELGVRARVFDDVHVEGALFVSDFDRQNVVGSIAGGSTPLAVGETVYRGAELALNWEPDQDAAAAPFASAALTWLPTARQESAFLAVSNNQPVGGSAEGKRLPYAPRWLATVQAGYRFGDWDLSAEVQSVDDQFADFANTVDPVANGNGQVGRIAGFAVWNLACNWTPAHSPWSAFVTLKNLADREYIVDRTRGIQLGNPRLFVVGLRYAF